MMLWRYCVISHYQDDLFLFYFLNLLCNLYITIQTIQIHIAATNYMHMFYLFFGIEKTEFC